MTTGLSWGPFEEPFTAGLPGSERRIDVLRAFIAPLPPSQYSGTGGPGHRRSRQSRTSTYTPPCASGWGPGRELADIITPNLTEAGLLLEEPYEAVPPAKPG